MSGIVLLILRIFATLSLYGFVGWVLYLIWQDLRTQSSLLNERKVVPISLLVKYVEQAPKMLYYTDDEVVIGRDPQCQCTLSDETASARHARLNYHHKQWWIEDLHSKNGTKLNGEKVSVPTVVISGDKISCGHTTITLNIAGDATNVSPTVQL